MPVYCSRDLTVVMDLHKEDQVDYKQLHKYAGLDCQIYFLGSLEDLLDRAVLLVSGCALFALLSLSRTQISCICVAG